ncbi:MAG: argininosuccinate lyase [Gemmatimonadota bacterium]|nr:argininosuccinate lyase [Gemmatimonadota bacterium]
MTTVAFRGAAAKAHRLWGGRFREASGGSAPEFDALNNSIGVDLRLWPFDVELSKAWAMGLYGVGVLTLAELNEIERGLDAVAVRIESGEPPVHTDEDVHTFIDRLLHDEIGASASRLHTGRSRNDQVATATRMWTMDAATRLDSAVRALQHAMLDKAKTLEDAIMPSYTHLQRSIPILGAHWLLSHFWPLDRDRARLRSARQSAAVLPLGAGAVAGSAYPVSRTLLQGTLGFEAVSANSVDAVSDRDFIAEILFAATLIATHLSRLAEDLLIYGSSEFGFVKFGERFTSGSSMMPQKRNPDALELARGSAARMLGNLTSLLATLKGLPSSYNKDLQDDKRTLFDAVDTLLLVLPAVAGTLAECDFQTRKMLAACSSSMMATDLADYLVRKGASFREAHGAVGTMIRRAESRGGELSALPFSAFQEAHALFESDVTEALSPDRSVRQREIAGGTGPNAVREQMEKARATLVVIEQKPNVP